MASNNIMGTPTKQKCKDFDLTPEQVRAADDKAERIRSLNQAFASAEKYTKADQYKTKVKAARDLVFNLRKELHEYVARPDFQNFTELQELRDIFQDFCVRIDTCNTSKPAKKLGPVDEVPHAKVEFVESVTGIEDMLVRIVMLENLHSSIPRIFVNCVGDNLGREGKMTSLAVYLPDIETVYSIDIQTLGPQSLTTSTTDEHVSIKSILEDKSIAKGVWDCRAISDAFWTEFGVLLDGVVEVQLLEIASGPIRKVGKGREKVPCLPGLERAFESRLNVTEDEEIRIFAVEDFSKTSSQRGKAEAERQLTPRRDIDPIKMKVWLGCADGDLFEAIMKRSLVQKVLLLPALYHYLIKHPKYTPGWEQRVAQETEMRLELSRSPAWKEVDPTERPLNWKPCDQIESPTSSRAGSRSSEDEFSPTPSSTGGSD